MELEGKGQVKMECRAVNVAGKDLDVIEPVLGIGNFQIVITLAIADELACCGLEDVVGLAAWNRRNVLGDCHVVDAMAEGIPHQISLLQHDVDLFKRFCLCLIINLKINLVTPARVNSNGF